MTDAELIEFVREFREGILDGRSSARMCAAVCLPLASLLAMHGVRARPIESDLGHCNHYWLRLADGRALDPTADQFNAMFPNLNYPPVYLGPPADIHPCEVTAGNEEGSFTRGCRPPRSPIPRCAEEGRR